MWNFKIESDDIDMDLDDNNYIVVKIVSDEDLKDGQDASYDIPDDILNILEDLDCFEIMEGIFEVGDIDRTRTGLIEAGLTEIN